MSDFGSLHVFGGTPSNELLNILINDPAYNALLQRIVTNVVSDNGSDVDDYRLLVKSLLGRIDYASEYAIMKAIRNVDITTATVSDLASAITTDKFPNLAPNTAKFLSFAADRFQTSTATLQDILKVAYLYGTNRPSLDSNTTSTVIADALSGTLSDTDLTIISSLLQNVASPSDPISAILQQIKSTDFARATITDFVAGVLTAGPSLSDGLVAICNSTSGLFANSTATLSDAMNTIVLIELFNDSAFTLPVMPPMPIPEPISPVIDDPFINIVPGDAVVNYLVSSIITTVINGNVAYVQLLVRGLVMRGIDYATANGIALAVGSINVTTATMTDLANQINSTDQSSLVVSDFVGNVTSRFATSSATVADVLRIAYIIGMNRPRLYMPYGPQVMGPGVWSYPGNTGGPDPIPNQAVPMIMPMVTVQGVDGTSGFAPGSGPEWTSPQVTDPSIGQGDGSAPTTGTIPVDMLPQWVDTSAQSEAAFLSNALNGALVDADYEFLTSLLQRVLSPSDPISAILVILQSADFRTTTLYSLADGIRTSGPSLSPNLIATLDKADAFFASSTATIHDALCTYQMIADTFPWTMSPMPFVYDEPMASDPSPSGGVDASGQDVFIDAQVTATMRGATGDGGTIGDGFSGKGKYAAMVADIRAGYLTESNLALIQSDLTIFIGPNQGATVTAIVDVLRNRNFNTTTVSELMGSLASAIKGSPAMTMMINAMSAAMRESSNVTVTALVSGMDSTRVNSLVASLSDAGTVTTSPPLVTTTTTKSLDSLYRLSMRSVVIGIAAILVLF